MAGSFKRIAAKSITNHTAHKEYDVQLVGGSGSFDGVEVFGYKGIYGKSEYTSGSESLTTNGFTNRDIHSAVVAPFYRPKFTDEYFAPRGWDDTIQVISIPALMSGDSIKPGSFTLTSGSITIVDDGEGRLCNSAYTYDYDVNKPAGSPDWVYSANLTSHYDLRQQQRTIDEYTGKSYTQQARGTFYNVLPYSGTVPYSDPYSVHTNYTSSFIRISGSGQPVDSSDGETELWRRTAAPSASFIWIDKLPPTIGYCSQWKGLSIVGTFTINDSYDPGNNEYRTLWQIGPAENADGVNPATVFARLTYVPDPASPRLRLQTYANGEVQQIAVTAASDGQTFTVSVHVQENFTTKLAIQNHTAGTSAAATTAGFFNTGSARLFNPEDRVISVGAGFANVDPDISQYNAITAPDPIPKDKKLFAFGGFDLHRFDVITNGDTNTGLFLDNYLLYKNSQLGNIFYDEGVAAITSKIHTYDNFYTDAAVGFKNSVNLTEHEYVCMISDQEFNMTQNPSILSDDSTAENPKIQGYVSSSNWDPYITTIGLYDKNYTLMAIGRLGRPLRKVEHYDQTFVVRWDT